MAFSISVVSAQQAPTASDQSWPKKVKLLRETHLEVRLGTTTASRKVPRNTEVEVVQVDLPNLQIRQNTATATVPAATTDFFESPEYLAFQQKEAKRLKPENEIAAAKEARSSTGKKININTASLSELISLPRIGNKTAAAIIKFRPFSKLEDLDRIPNIGPATIKQLKDLVVTETAESPSPPIHSDQTTAQSTAPTTAQTTVQAAEKPREKVTKQQASTPRTDSPPVKVTPPPTGNDAKSNSTRGSSDTVAVEGSVRVMKKNGAPIQVTMNGASMEIQVGMVLKQGSKIKTGASASVTLMFDNGAVMEIKPETEFLIEQFDRNPFDPAGVDYKTMEDEPTQSTTKLRLDTGVILMGVKKLKEYSEFQIGTRVGMTGIRGTSLFVKYDEDRPEDGTIVGVTEGKVEFLTPSGTVQPISAGEAFEIIDSPTGATIKPNPPGASVLMAETRVVDRAIRQTVPAKSFESAPVSESSEDSEDVAPVKSEMIKVEGGSLPRDSQVPNRSVKTFEIGKYEVTWGEWQKVRDWALSNGYNFRGDGAGSSDNHPVTHVSWYDVVKWCNAKSEMERLEPVYQVRGDVYKSGAFGKEGSDLVKKKAGTKGYRLPTDAEWEWAARGGKKSNKYTYAGSNDLNAVGWSKDNSGGKPHPVGQKQPNELGIYDMSGNVLEWCEDVVGTSARRNRGSSYASSADGCTFAQRGSNLVDAFNIHEGFRLARSSGN